MLIRVDLFHSSEDYSGGGDSGGILIDFISVKMNTVIVASHKHVVTEEESRPPALSPIRKLSSQKKIKIKTFDQLERERII